MSPLSDLLRKPGATLLDVRTLSEFQDGHAPGAMHIPVEELSYRTDELRGCSTPLIVYCKSGGRSRMAQHILEQDGFVEVHNGGGLSDVLAALG
ncbi:MAG: rhodanese-like domain-containing protein [Sphingomonadales bacterium]|nr:rhodanese-like domain-containing protein [Sphingomonadales bacterium]